MRSPMTGVSALSALPTTTFIASVGRAAGRSKHRTRSPWTQLFTRRRGAAVGIGGRRCRRGCRRMCRDSGGPAPRG
jgi:hypothetical protein